MSECAFCGHPDRKHRIVDAIEERREAGERFDEVLEDYGLTSDDFYQMKADVALAEFGWKP